MNAALEKKRKIGRDWARRNKSAYARGNPEKVLSFSDADWDALMEQRFMRGKAKEQGLKRYFTGKPCPNGHIAERYVAGGNCVECQKIEDRSEKNRARQRVYTKRYNKKNPITPEQRKALLDKQRLRRKKESVDGKWYFPGTPCKYGHIEKRLVSNGACYECAKIRRRKHKSEKTRARAAVWRHENRERRRLAGEEWRERNKDKVRVYRSRRKARKLQAEGRHTASDIAAILKAQRNRCAICREKLGKKYHIDHIVPLSAKGSDWPSNLQITHPHCNIKKGAKDPISFMREMGRLL